MSIPVGTKFIGIAPDVDTYERKSAQANSPSNVYTIEDIQDGSVPDTRTITINGTTQDLSANRSWTISTGLTVGTTPVTSGTDGRVFFQAGGVVQQDANFTYDNTLKRLGLKAVGTAATDIPLQVLNSSGTVTNFKIQGNETIVFQSGSFATCTFVQDYNQAATLMLRTTGNSQAELGNDFNAAPGSTYTGALKLYNWSSALRTRIQAVGTSFWADSSSQVVIGSSTAGARLDVRAQGALSTDIAFRVRNSADTADLVSFRGDGSEWIQSVPFRHAGTLTGGTNAAQSLFIGYNSVALGTSGTRSTIVGTGTGTSPAGNTQTGIGWGLSTGGWSTSIAIGAGAILTANNQCVMGSETYPFNVMQIGTGGFVQSAANVNNMLLSVGGVANGFTLNTDLSSKYFRIQSQGGSGTGNGAPIQFSVAPAGASGFGSNAFVIPFEVRGDGAGLNQYQTATPKVPSVSITDGYVQYSNDITAGNAAPHFRTENGSIVKLYQETTGVAAATFVANTSGILNDTATFDGYTIGQVVKALRNLGILA